jgi:hypothetical protein
MSTAQLRNVYFRRSNGEFILIANSVSEHDAHLVIQHFLDDHNYKSYYTRSWEVDRVKWYDVGSWTEFFVWAYEEDIERYKNERN